MSKQATQYSSRNPYINLRCQRQTRKTSEWIILIKNHNGNTTETTPMNTARKLERTALFEVKEQESKVAVEPMIANAPPFKNH